jgi:hypothetical protein
MSKSENSELSSSKSKTTGLGSTTTTSVSSKVHPSNDPPELDPDSYALEKFKLYETRAVTKILKFNSIFVFITNFNFIDSFID